LLKPIKRALCLAACVFLLALSGAWSQRSPSDPAAQNSKQLDSFGDFALKHINPQNTDYGCQIDEARKLAVDEFVKNANSWAALFALLFLILSFLMLLHQHCEQNRREIIAATFLARYHNAWLDARAQAEQGIRRYNELVNTSAAAEAISRSQLPNAETAQATAENSDLNRNAKLLATSASACKNGVDENGDGPAVGRAVRRQARPTGEPEVDLIAQISSLQEQLSACHQREKNLLRELSKVHRRLHAEPVKQNVAS